MKLPSACRAIFNHFADFAAALPAASVVATPLAPAPYSAELTLLRLKELVLMVGRSTPLMFTGCLNTGSARIVLPLEKTEALRVNGLMIRPGDMAVFEPGAGYDGVWFNEANWASLVLPAATLEALLEAPPHSAAGRAGAHTVLRANPTTWAEAVSLITAARQVVLEDPEVLTVAEALRGLNADLLEALRDLFANAQRNDAANADTIVAGRQHIVRALEDALGADPQRTRSSKDLCAAIGVMPSRLRDAIETSFGLELEDYLQLRRLAIEHTALRTAERLSAALEQGGSGGGVLDMDSFRHEPFERLCDAPAPIAVPGTE